MSENDTPTEPAAHASADDDSHGDAPAHGDDADHGGHAIAVAPPLEDLFDRNEIIQLDQDDVDAGRALGKMLSLFFLYTVLAMSVVAWWTFSTVDK